MAVDTSGSGCGGGFGSGCGDNDALLLLLLLLLLRCRCSWLGRRRHLRCWSGSRTCRLGEQDFHPVIPARTASFSFSLSAGTRAGAAQYSIRARAFPSPLVASARAGVRGAAVSAGAFLDTRGWLRLAVHDLDDFDRGTAIEGRGGGRGAAALGLDGEGPEGGIGSAFLFGLGFSRRDIFDY